MASPPPTLTMITVTAHAMKFFVWTGASARFRFTNSQLLAGPVDDVLIMPFEREILTSDGHISIDLPANNDPEWTQLPPYNVEITSEGHYISGTLFLPYNGGPVDLADRLNVAAPTPGANYIPSASLGAPGGVAALGQDGYVPDSQLRYPILVLDLDEEPPPDLSPNTLVFRKTS